MFLRPLILQKGITTRKRASKKTLDKPKMEGKIKSLVHTWLAEVDPKVIIGCQSKY